jgi:hypothetical protein
VYEDFSSWPDTHSIALNNSFYPPGGKEYSDMSMVSMHNVPEGDLEAATVVLVPTMWGM